MAEDEDEKAIPKTAFVGHGQKWETDMCAIRALFKLHNAIEMGWRWRLAKLLLSQTNLLFCKKPPNILWGKMSDLYNKAQFICVCMRACSLLSWPYLWTDFETKVTYGLPMTHRWHEKFKILRFWKNFLLECLFKPEGRAWAAGGGPEASIYKNANVLFQLF